MSEPRPHSLSADDGVLVVVPSLAGGGTERHLMAVLPALRERGFAVEVFALRGPDVLDDALRDRGVPVTAPARHIPGGGGLAGRLNALAGAAALRHRIGRRPPRAIHFFLPEAYLLGGMLGGAGRVPRRIMSRRSLNRYQNKHRLGRRGEAKLHGRMDAVLGNSRAVLADLKAEGVSPHRLGLIHNGVCMGRFAGLDRDAARRALGLDPRATVLAIAANLIPYKGHADLLTALAACEARLPDGWRLLIAGRDDGIGPDLKALGGRLGLDAHLRWLGFVQDIETVFAACDLVLQPSHEEGLPNAVLEAMACGKAVIATAVGGLPELVAPRSTGLLVPANDPAALGAALVELANDRGLRQTLGLAGRRRAERDFSLDACTARYARLYDGLLRGDRRPVRDILDGPAPARQARAS